MWFFAIAGTVMRNVAGILLSLRLQLSGIKVQQGHRIPTGRYSVRTVAWNDIDF